jgi:hypothetical protein
MTGLDHLATHEGGWDRIAPLLRTGTDPLNVRRYDLFIRPQINEFVFAVQVDDSLNTVLNYEV